MAIYDDKEPAANDDIGWILQQMGFTGPQRDRELAEQTARREAQRANDRAVFGMNQKAPAAQQMTVPTGFGPQNLLIPVTDDTKRPTAQRQLVSRNVAAEPMPEPAEDSPVKDPAVREMLLSKLKSDFSDDKYKETKLSAEDQKSGLGWLQALSGFGDAIAGRSPSESAQVFNKIRQDVDANTIGDFENRKKQLIENANAEAQIQNMQRQADQMDPSSNASKSFRKIIEVNFPQVAKAYGDNWQSVTAADQDNIFKPLQLKEQAEARKETARLANQSHTDALNERIEARKEKEQKLSDAQLEELNDFDDSINKAQVTIDLLGNNPGWTGTVDGRIPDMFVGNDQVAWRSAVGRMTDAYRKLITGTGASNQELSRLESRLPQPTDTFSNFKSKAQSFITEVKKAKSTHLKNLEKAGKNINEFKSGPDVPQKFRVSNGKETLMIDQADLKHAIADGYKQVE